MSSTWLYALVSVVLVSAISLVGVASLLLRERALRAAISFLVSLAVGAMLGDAFIHLLPDSFRRSPTSVGPPLAVLGGFFLFFVLEKFLVWRHEHSRSTIKSVGYVNLVADGVHNLTDGMLIGASYVLGVPAGLATTVAVVFHEIPHEFGAFGVLLHAGFTPVRALLFNYLSALVAVAGTILTLLLGQHIAGLPAIMGPVAAGGFIYIAASDLIPELHQERNLLRTLGQLACMAIGVAVMALLRLTEHA